MVDALHVTTSYPKTENVMSRYAVHLRNPGDASMKLFRQQVDVARHRQSRNRLWSQPMPKSPLDYKTRNKLVQKLFAFDGNGMLVTSAIQMFDYCCRFTLSRDQPHAYSFVLLAHACLSVALLTPIAQPPGTPPKRKTIPIQPQKMGIDTDLVSRLVQSKPGYSKGQLIIMHNHVCRLPDLQAVALGPLQWIYQFGKQLRMRGEVFAMTTMYVELLYCREWYMGVQPATIAAAALLLALGNLHFSQRETWIHFWRTIIHLDSPVADAVRIMYLMHNLHVWCLAHYGFREDTWYKVPPKKEDWGDFHHVLNKYDDPANGNFAIAITRAPLIPEQIAMLSQLGFGLMLPGAANSLAFAPHSTLTRKELEWDLGFVPSIKPISLPVTPKKKRKRDDEPAE